MRLNSHLLISDLSDSLRLSLSSLSLKGKAIANGTYSYLKSTGINFVNLLQTEDKIENEDLDALDEETRRVRSFSRQLSITDADVKRRNSGRRQRRLSQVSMVDPENIGSDLSIASEVVKVEEFVSHSFLLLYLRH